MRGAGALGLPRLGVIEVAMHQAAIVNQWKSVAAGMAGFGPNCPSLSLPYWASTSLSPREREREREGWDQEREKDKRDGDRRSSKDTESDRD